MNGGQDLGGMHGFGPVEAEPNEPVFHSEWERRAFALTVAMGYTGSWNIDMARHARETINPADYLRLSYYEIWLEGLERLLRERDLLRDDEIETGQPQGPVKPLARSLAAAEVAATLATGSSARRDAEDAPAPQFKPGDKVRARVIHPTGHTRLPGYVRGRAGTIARVNGRFVLPDANATGNGESPETCYSVGFAGTELWGPDSDPTVTIHVDLWESHLDAA